MKNYRNRKQISYIAKVLSVFLILSGTFSCAESISYAGENQTAETSASESIKENVGSDALAEIPESKGGSSASADKNSDTQKELSPITRLPDSGTVHRTAADSQNDEEKTDSPDSSINTTSSRNAKNTAEKNKEKQKSALPSSDSKQKTDKKTEEAPKLKSAVLPNSDRLRKLFPEFSPNTYNYILTSPSPFGNSIAITVDAGVEVTLDGEPVPIDENGDGTLHLKYDKYNCVHKVILAGKSGKTSTYTFNSSQLYGFEPMKRGTLAVYNSKGRPDKENISAVETDQTANSVSTNLRTVRIGWTASIKKNADYKAELVDINGKVLGTYTYSAGSTAENHDFLTDELVLEKGQNLFYIRYFVSGEANNYHNTIILINRNTRDESTDTTVKSLSLRVNGKEYLTGFDPEIRKYKVVLPKDCFDINSDNDVILKVSTDKSIKIDYGRINKGGHTYVVYTCKKGKAYANDKFTVTVNVTAEDGVTKDRYEIEVTKTGRTGMYMPDMYRVRDIYITGTRQDMAKTVTFGSTGVYINGEPVSREERKAGFCLYIDNTDILKQVKSSSSTNTGEAYDLLPLKPGKTSGKLVFKNKTYEFSEKVDFIVRYGQSYLKARIDEANAVIRRGDAEGRAYKDGARARFRKAIDSAESVYTKNKDTKDAAGLDLISDTAQNLTREIEVYRNSETGQLITGFDIPSGFSERKYDYGITETDIILPGSIDAIIDGKKKTISGISWLINTPFDRLEPKEYRYTLILPRGYVLADNVARPMIRVMIEKFTPYYVKDTIKLPSNVLIQYVEKGTPKSAINLPGHLEAYKRPPIAAYGTYKIPVLWEDNDGYNGNKPGTYTFTAYLDPNQKRFQYGDYMYDDTMQTIRVIVVDPKGHGGGNGGGNSNSGSGNGSGTGGGIGSGNGTGSGNGNGPGSGGGSGKAGAAGVVSQVAANSNSKADSTLAKTEKNKSASKNGSKASGKKGGGGGKSGAPKRYKVSEIQNAVHNKAGSSTHSGLLALLVLICIVTGAEIERRKQDQI